MSEDEEEEMEMEEEEDTEVSDVESVKFEMEDEADENGADVINLDSDYDEVIIEKEVLEEKDDGIEVLDDVMQNGKGAEKEGGDSDDKAEEVSENGKKKKKKKKSITDEEYFADVSSKEMKYLKKHLVSEKELDTQTIVCTACYKQVNYKQEGAVMRHADLAVPICKKCHKFYFKGEWTKDEEGFYEHCRWCANGGELMCCDNCPNAFCKKCIKRNLGRSKVSEIDDAAEWRCLACEPGQVAKLRALYFSIWTYNVKMAQTEEAKEVAKVVKKDSGKGQEKSKFVEDAHKDGFEVTKILTNYLQKSQKGWKEKDAMAQLDQGDVTKLVVKFRTIIKVAHHNLDQLDKNLLEGCLSSYPEVTEDMLEAKAIPLEQNGHMKKEGSDIDTKKADKKPKKKPAKKVAVAAEVVKEEDTEEKKKEQKELREKRKEERSGKKGTEAEQYIEEAKEEADVKDETLEKDISTKESSKESNETKKNDSDNVVAAKKQGTKTKPEQETPSKTKEGKKSKLDEEKGGGKGDDKGDDSKTIQNGDGAGSPDVSKDMFDDTDDNDVKGEAEKNSSMGLDEANKVARACLLETSSDEDTVQKSQSLDKPTDENKEKDSDSATKETDEKAKPDKDGEEKKGLKVKSVNELNKDVEEPSVAKSDDDTVMTSPKKKLKKKKELDKLKRRSDEKRENRNSTEKSDDGGEESGTDKKPNEPKKEKKPANRKKAPVFSSSDSDDSDEDNLGIIGESPEKKKKMTKKEEEKEKEREEKKILEREKRKQEKKQKKKEAILNGTYEEKKKGKSKDNKDSETSEDEKKAEHKLLRKKVGKQLKKLRKKVEDIDISQDKLLKQKVKADVTGLGDHIKGELQEEGFIDVSCHPDLYTGKVEADEWDMDIERLCNFDSLKAKKKGSKDSSDDIEKEEEGKKKSKGEKKKKEKEKGLGDMSSGSEGNKSDGGESDADPKNICASMPHKNEIAKAEVLDSSDSDGDMSDDSTTKEDDKSEKKTKAKKEKKEKKEEDDGDSDADSEDTKKAKKKNEAILNMKLSETDSSEEERNHKEKMEKKKEKLENAESSDSSDFGKMSAATLYGSAKKKEVLKKRKRAIASDDDGSDEGGDKESDSDPDDLSTDEDSDGAPKKKEVKKRGKKKKKSSSSEDSDEADRPKKKRKRIKKGSDESDDDEEASPTKRHDIKKVIKDKNLADETKTAAAIERERRDRMKERQAKYNEMFGKHEDKEKDAIATECVLDFDEETKEVLVEVDKRLVKKLKPHQVGGIKFMWDCCFESLAQIKAKKIPGGAILGHCMGLGKTLQSVTLCHTVMSNPKVKVNRIMVICPVNVVKNWADEFDKWLIGDLALDVYEMSKEKDNRGRADKLENWFEEGGVLLIGYDMFRNLTNATNKKFKPKLRETFAKCLLDPGADLIICDEGHLLKNEKSAINAAVNRIKTPRRIVLTGTPLQNNLKEYYEMVNFVKPSLMGTRKEFMNRFVNPIVNGQHSDSTERDIRMMKKRSFILNDLLKGCMQRLDYNVLVPYLMPKLEYVLTIQLGELQKTLYKYYLANYAKAGQIGQDGKLMGGKKGGLFYDVQNLSRIWNHPYILLLSKIRKDAKEDDESGSEGSLKDFIDDNSDDETEESTEESDESDEDSDDSDAPKKKKKAPPKKRATRADKPEDLVTLDDKQVVQKMSGGGAWWNQFLADDQELDDVLLGSKMILLMDILKECAMIGDKILVFSQSILSLDLIEEFLEKVHNNHEVENRKKKKKDADALEDLDTWVPGKDYYRMDGSTAADTRKIWCKYFNKESNHRMRLFLISTKAGGLGINLVAANRVILFDASWNPAHDVQSIFRVFRFGQTKPVYIYRFIAKGTMEEKIYDRQVTKQSLSARVVDEHQIESHFTMNELEELYEFKDEPLSERPTPAVPKDRLLAELVEKHKDLVWDIHNHDSLLENKVDENLTEEERKRAWEEFEQEKKGFIQQRADPMMLQQMQAAQQMQSLNPMAIQAQLRAMYPEMSHDEVMARTRWTIMQLQSQMQGQMYPQQQQQGYGYGSQLAMQQQMQQEQQRRQQQERFLAEQQKNQKAVLAQAQLALRQQQQQRPRTGNGEIITIDDSPTKRKEP